MHLTNFTLNKKSENYVHTSSQAAGEEVTSTAPTAVQEDPAHQPAKGDPADRRESPNELNSRNGGDDAEDDCDEGGSKRLMSSVFALLESQGFDIPRLWGRIEAVVAKTVVAMAPLLVLHFWPSTLPRHLRELSLLQSPRRLSNPRPPPPPLTKPRYCCRPSSNRRR